MLNSAITQPSRPLWDTTSSLLDSAEACLFEQPGDTWGKALQPPHHSQANLSRWQDQAPGGREAHLEQKTEHGPPAQEMSPR